jgi:Ni,Fe-hydrogenase III small subunit/Pyruvate/2-oxoacid:ferredoxin oxidoreductase delta subunit
MFKILKTRFHQGHQTNRFPDQVPALSDHYRGRPDLFPQRCRAGCRECQTACPTEAITLDGGLRLDLGKCLFCTACMDVCPEHAIAYSRDHRMAGGSRADLVLTGREMNLAEGMAEQIHRILGRALRLREVCAGGCNACDMDINVLNTVGWDLSRFGIQFVASPRHADGIAVTGPISRNMRHALQETYAAIPSPKIVIAIGACAISGGPFAGSPAVTNGIDEIVPVDLYIPGCPPPPLTILDGLLRLIRRIHEPVDQAAAVAPELMVAQK